MSLGVLYTLWLPLYTVAKLPFPISSSMLNDPTTLSPVLERLEDEDCDGCAAISLGVWPYGPEVDVKWSSPPYQSRCGYSVAVSSFCMYTRLTCVYSWDRP